MEEQANIKVIGIGDAGNHIVNRMIEEKVKNVTFVQINTDVQILKVSKTKNVIQIGRETTHRNRSYSSSSANSKRIRNINNRNSNKTIFI